MRVLKVNKFLNFISASVWVFDTFLVGKGKMSNGIANIKLQCECILAAIKRKI